MYLDDDLYDLQVRHPKGIFSHDTAMMLHDLTTFSPFVYHVTFPSGYELSDVDAKEQYIRAYYVDENELSEEYIQIIDSWELNPIRVTNLEKTIVDSFREQKLMTFIIQEMIDDYIQRDPKDVRKLIEYAERFGVADVVGREILPFVLK